jgi:hypothetical protein
VAELQGFLMMCLRISSLKRRVAAVIVLGLFAAASCAGAAEPLLRQGQARVVLVGDSITGLSRNYATGFAHQMDWALAQTYPGCRPNLVSLGGSGQGVRSWRDVELRSRTQEVLLDVPGIDVKAALSQPAEVLIIMLGMNDVLAAYVVDEQAAWDEWKANYRELIAARNFEAGYGARWIRSDRERTVNLALSTQAFAGTNHLTAYLNGREVYSGLLTGEPKRGKTVEVRLERGWNALAFRSNHVTWQWQCSVDVTPVGEDSLDDLRYSIVPKVPGP